MIDTTLCFLLKDKEILIAMKKRGFGMGKWNGVGGKVDAGESVEAAAIREVQEEIGVDIAPENLKARGSLRFYFENKPEWNSHMYIFTAKEWAGELAESEEMKPQWFNQDDLPWNQMWVSDKDWLLKLIAGEKISGEFKFNSEGDTILDFKLG